jgi:hypothetical protein
MSYVSHSLFLSDRLHSIKCSGSGSGSEVSTPHAGAVPSLQFQDSPDSIGGSEHGSNIVANVADASGCATVSQNGGSFAKKVKICIHASSVAPSDSTAVSTSSIDQKVVPTAADLLSVAVEIKRNNPGCGVKKVLLEILQQHPDWAITEHRVGKLLHENGLTTVKKPSSASSEGNYQPSLEQQHRAEAVVPDILSLPQPHAAFAELGQAPPSPSSQNSGSPQQSAGIVDLDRLFEPLKYQQVPNEVESSEFGEGATVASSDC